MSDNELFPYQEAGVAHLLKLPRSYLADEPGMGKTVEACTALVRAGAKRPLVICPASVVPVWRAEWKIWGDPKVVLSVLSYNRVSNEKYRRAILQVRPDYLVLDEAQYVKNKTAQRTKWIIGDGRNVPLTDVTSITHVWLLSGTPYPNTQFELHHTLRQLWPEMLKTRGIYSTSSWLNMFDWMPGYKPQSPPTILSMKPEGVAKLRPILDEIMLERTLKSVGHELPDLDIRVTPLQIADDVIADMHLDDNEEHISTSRRLLGEVKVPLAADIILDELLHEQYWKTVIFAHHTGSLDYVQLMLDLAGINFVRLDGGTREKDRATAVELFQTSKGHRVFLGQQVAGGIGITLTESARVELLEPSWVPDDNFQAIKRVHRVGQEQHVLARLWTVGGTLDDSIIRSNHRKTSVKGALKKS